MSDTELKVRYSKREKDLLIEYPRRCDGSLMYYHLCCEHPHYNFGMKDKLYEMEKSLVKELEERGYDIKTLKFSIKLKKVEDKNDGQNT